jgi:hypothetical protein
MDSKSALSGRAARIPRVFCGTIWTMTSTTPQVEVPMLHSGEVGEVADLPDSSAKSSEWSRGVAHVAAMLAVGAYLYLMRRPSSISSATFWAEDGLIFFRDAAAQGWGSLFQPYAGQLFVFQRAVAIITALLPTVIQPWVYSVAATMAAVASCAIVLSPRWRFRVPIYARCLCFVALLCSPAADEVYLSLANSHWWLAVGLLLMGFLADPISRRVKLGELAFAAITALSGFAAIYSLPCLAVRAHRNRSRHSLTLLGVASVGVLVQMYYLVASARQTGLSSMLSQPKTDALILVRRIFAGPVLGDTGLAQVWPARLPDMWVWLIPVALGAAMLTLWIRGPRLEATALVAAISGGYVLMLWSLRDPLDALWVPIVEGRYVLVPVAAMYLTLILASPLGLWRRAATGVACVMLATGIASDYHLAPVDSVNWSQFSSCMEKAVTPTCSVVIPPAWTLVMPPTGH